MIIAVIKALIVAAVFMELRERNSLTLTFAGAGFFWLGVMLWLAFTDYTTRSNFLRQCIGVCDKRSGGTGGLAWHYPIEGDDHGIYSSCAP